MWLLNASQCLCSLPSTWSLRRAFNCVIAAYASRPRSGLVVSMCGFRWLLCLILDMMWLIILMSEDPSLNPITQHQETQLTLTTFHPQTLATSPTPKPSTPNPPTHLHPNPNPKGRSAHVSFFTTQTAGTAHTKTEVRVKHGYDQQQQEQEQEQGQQEQEQKQEQEQ